jgi:hypothetical protein
MVRKGSFRHPVREGVAPKVVILCKIQILYTGKDLCGAKEQGINRP